MEDNEEINYKTWLGKDGELAKSVMNEFVPEMRKVYSVQNGRIHNDFEIVEEIWSGDYRRRQILELVQNGADAILDASSSGNGGRIKIVLDKTGIYCANEGASFSFKGIEAIGFPMRSGKSEGIGRYGQGFRSVLAVTNNPRIYSRAGSFHYSFEHSYSLLTEFVEGLEPIPIDLLGTFDKPKVNILACPMAVDPLQFLNEDPILADLMSWAVTVVHLPFSSNSVVTAEMHFDDLQESLRGFPHEFLSFVPHVKKFEFDIRDDRWETTQLSCESSIVPEAIEASGLDVWHSTIDVGGGKKEEFLVVTRTGIAIPEGLPQEGVRKNRRVDEHGRLLPVQISWAIPLSVGNKRGRFWFFFPTSTETTLKGILNGPWDTDGARTNILSPTTSPYNAHLVQLFARLIVETIPYLLTMFPEDIGRYLDLLPARGDEEGSDIAKLLVAEVRRVIVQRESIPNLDGKLVRPDSLRVPPSSVTPEIIALWSSVSGAARNFPHWATLNHPNRIFRVKTYIEEAMHVEGVQALEIKEWLELLVSDSAPSSSIGALAVAKELAGTNFVIRDQVLTANIVLLADGDLVPPKPGKAFMGDVVLAKPGISVIDENVQSSEVARNFLVDDCGITSIDEAADLDVLFASWPKSPKDQDWESFWATLKNSTDDEVLEAITRHSIIDIRARCVDGSWKKINECLFPGLILSPGKQDDQFIVDVNYHSKAISLLARFGLGETPLMVGLKLEIENDFITYVKESVVSAKLSQAKIDQIINSVQKIPAFFAVANLLSDDARSRLTSWALALDVSFLRLVTKPGAIEIDQPLLWWCRVYGLAETSLGPRPFGETLTPSCSRFSLVAPVLKLDGAFAYEFGLVSTITDLPTHCLQEIFERVSEVTDVHLVGETLSQLARTMSVPEKVPASIGFGFDLIEPSKIQVEIDFEIFRKLAEKNIPVVLAPSLDAAEILSSKWGLENQCDQRHTYQIEGADAPVLLADKFFLLDQMHPRVIAGVNYVECSGLERVVSTINSGQTLVKVNEGLDDRVLYVVVDDENSDLQVLKAANLLLKLELGADDISAILSQLKDDDLQNRKRLVRQASTEIERVQALFTVTDMQQLLPAAVLDEIPGDREDGHVLAEMLIAVHGPQLLRHSKGTLRKAGFDAPEIWAGGQPAMKFVTDLGFDRSFAGFKSDEIGAHLDVPGRVELHDLHNYQVPLKDKIKDFVQRGPVDGAWRSLLYLPTGAGKTRVTVDAVLELLDAGHFKDSPVLWITQSHELCEQAVQAFQEVWSSRGSSGTLSIDRLWDRYTVEPAGIPHEYVGQIVVATIDKLKSPKVFKSANYEWLANAGLVIIDEAHKAVSRTYTEVLRWFETGVGRPSAKNTKADARPLLGLSATPAKRGVSARFRERIEIPPVIQNGKELTNVEYLRQEKVLAIPKHKELEFIGENIELDGNAVEKIRNLPGWLPAEVEEKLALNQLRNQSILAEIRSLDESWQVIVFALSVSHAQFLAALLTREGISAAAVYSGTTPGVRRLHVKNFREGKIRVLTNFNVLSTGFDAPKVRAILIARPCYSDSAYLQMIGRGLRGPKNGGTDECLVIDIKDNIQNMPIDLVYKRMSGWFSPDGPDESNSFDSESESERFEEDFDSSLEDEN